MQTNSSVVKMPSKGARKSDRKKVTVQKEDEWLKYSKGEFKYAPFQSLSEHQTEAYESALVNPLTVAIGPAGTGKSYSGASAAIQHYAQGTVKKIIIARSPLPTGTTAGFRPGDTYEKLMPYLMPLIQTFKKVLKTDSGSDGFFNYLWEKKVIEIQDLETIKGMSFDDTFLIIEEAQECDMEQLKNLFTRPSDTSFIYLNGDIAQSNKRLRENALQKYVECFRDFNAKLESGALDHLMVDGKLPEWLTPINIVEFDKSDRNGRGNFVRKMLEINDMYNI
ncbi:PhoH-like phosphate starvation-inducible protein [Serratia phage phiMAM1]|uniref:PhoH-like phosphate starvation-inducible protein n=1 Tax=Serratia phage phiMAM1 TaxID=1262513 RepID=K7YY18_9CAUD|nr:PhoH-like phosphate starvation-inducible protein [Serratia phage phiMAM1]AFX93595.1 PhoH-like phosphate starvation-inducible protein [Serratia phage phiMAM1]